MNDLNSSVELLDIVASKFGYDNILLQSSIGTSYAKPKCCCAMFGWLGSFGTIPVRANGKLVQIAHVDDNYNIISNSCIYAELVKTLYRTLERNGIISDGKQTVDADDVPDFMIGCVLNGYA